MKIRTSVFIEGIFRFEKEKEDESVCNNIIFMEKLKCHNTQSYTSYKSRQTSFNKVSILKTCVCSMIKAFRLICLLLLYFPCLPCDQDVMTMCKRQNRKKTSKDSHSESDRTIVRLKEKTTSSYLSSAAAPLCTKN